ncbi:MAG: hypothetical protein CMJ11_06300 [Pelagibacterales bacterium]|nr:hypothetical protein [Pelagibacterales bacterium]|tara:strand:+ start:1111 stop:2589 length:1479 start_codon:yes stop_codon:yes gene_type:complete
MVKYRSNPPNSENVMASISYMGHYNLATALADIIDNSIKAKAKKISINCQWNNNNPFITILDDGYGMSTKELENAMKLNSSNPNEVREKDDLGRFGLGLKTASFSQAKILTVITSNGNIISGGEWDLDNVGSNYNWGELEVKDIEKEAKAEVKSKKSFTKVIWKNLEFLTNNYTLKEDEFDALISDTINEIALTFHRFIKGEEFKNKINILVNGLEAPVIDPFMEGHAGQQELKGEVFTINNKKITMTPFIIPHYSKIKKIEYEKQAGKDGYIRKQGFYIYRNRRLIISGEWFGLAQYGELSNLARIKVDLPNTLDKEFKIKIDKNSAEIDPRLKPRFRDLIKRIKEKSGRVYRNRGSKIDKVNSVNFWTRKIKEGEIKYDINVQHPVIKSALDKLDSKAYKEWQNIFRFIAQSFPAESMNIDIIDNPKKVSLGNTDREKIIDFCDIFVKGQIKNGLSQEKILEILKNTEPFKKDFNILIDHLKEENIINVL